MKKRMLTPDFFSDEELIEGLDIAGRLFYLGLWSVAEDSGVFLMSPLGLKMKLFPGDDIPPQALQGYIDELIRMNKIVPFEHGGKQYGWLKNFHRHQKLDNPPAPVLPLPSWITFVESENRRKRSYEVDKHELEAYLSGTRPGHVQSLQWTCTYERKGKEKKGTEVTEPAQHELHVHVQDNNQPLLPQKDVDIADACQEIDLRMTMHMGRQFIGKDKDVVCIKQLLTSGVPLDFILSGIDNVFKRYPDKKINTFSYCMDPIREEWGKRLAKQSLVEPIDFTSYARESRASPRDAPVGRYIPRDLAPEVAAALEEDERLEQQRLRKP